MQGRFPWICHCTSSHTDTFPTNINETFTN